MFQIANVNKIYKTRKEKVQALTNINLLLPSSGLIFINGKSGSGKSTLLNIIGGLDKATSGSIKYNNVDLSSLNEKNLTKYRNEFVGFVFQDFCLIENITVYENVKLALDILSNKNTNYNLINKTLERLGIANLASRKASELSAGQKQRVSIARALVKNPKVLLCDEPTGNLDSETSNLILNVLKEVSKNILVLVISHNYIESYKYASRIIKLDSGKIVEDRSTQFGNSTFVKDNDTLYINDMNFLSNNDSALIDENLRRGRINHLRPIKNLFLNTSVVYVSKEETKLKTHKMSLSKINTIFKHILSKNLAKMTLLVAIGSAVLSLFSVCQMATNFDSDSLTKSQILNSDLDLVPFTKYRPNQKGYITSDINRFNDDEVEDFKNNDADFLVNTPFIYYKNNDDNTATIDQLISGKVDNSAYQPLYSLSNFGTVVTTKERYLKNFNLNEITYLATSEEYKDYGIYITDYLADTMLYHSPELSYENLVGKIKIVLDITYEYVNGIIFTGYKDKLTTLLTQYQSGNVDYSSDDYSYYSNYIKNYLQVSYSFEPNFVNLICTADFRSIISNNKVTLEGVFDESQNIKVTSQSSSLYFFSDNETAELTKSARFSYTVLNKMFNVSYNENERNQILKDKKVTLKYTNPLNEEYSIKLNSITCKGVGGERVSKDVLSEMLTHQFFYYRAYVYDKNNAFNLYAKYKDNAFSVGIDKITGAVTLEALISSYSDLFYFISIILIIICAGIFLYISYNSVKRKTYEIGVLKSLGISIKSLYQVYLINFFIEALISIVLYFAFVFIFKNACNTILISAIETKTGYINYFTGISIFNLTLDVVAIDLACLLAFLLAGFTIPLIAIKNIKTIDIIKTKY